MIPFILSAKVHYAKIEPFDRVTLKSSVRALVLSVKRDFEGKFVKNAKIIHLDDKLDKISFQDTIKSIKLLEHMVKINTQIASTLKQSVNRQEGYFNRISKLSTVSKTQKDNAYSAYSSIKTQYLGIKEKLLSLKKQLIDLRYKKAKLQDSIEKKNIFLKNRYLYSLLVRKGDFVGMGTPLMTVDDLSKGKLVLYLDAEELDGIKEKRVYINDQLTDYKIAKIWREADSKFISSYKTEIYIPVPKKDKFSTLLKVEIK